jgi:hypothetical protein
MIGQYQGKGMGVVTSRNYVSVQKNEGGKIMIKGLMLFFTIVVTILVIFYETTTAENKNLTIPKALITSIETACPRAKLVEGSDFDAEMRKYLSENKRAYYTVIHDDFNGDKLADWALLVKCQNKKDTPASEKLIVLIKKPNDGYSINVLEEFPYICDNVYIRPAPPGNLREWDSSKIVKVKFKGIKRVFFEKSSGVYFWGKDNFQYVQTSD